MVKMMKMTINIVLNKNEYDEYVEMLNKKDFKLIGTRLFEDFQSYVKIKINLPSVTIESEVK